MPDPELADLLISDEELLEDVVGHAVEDREGADLVEGGHQTVARKRWTR